MKKYFFSLITFAMAAFVGLGVVSCGDDDVDAGSQPGSIYGIVTELGTAEPMKAVGVELYKGSSLLLKTVTFDDGHFEFSDLSPEQYKVNVVADGYDVASGNVIVEAGRQARIDLQIKKLNPGILVRTSDASVEGAKVTLGGIFTANPYYPNEVGIIYAPHNDPKNGGTLIKCALRSGYDTFYHTIDNMENGTYYFIAYAKNNSGTVYGEVKSFTISDYIVIENFAVQKRDLGSGEWDVAKEMCEASRVGGFSDWRLPTIAELSIIYAHRTEIGGLASTGRYWSSTPGSNGYYYYLDFSDNGKQSQCPTIGYYRYVRAVRTVN